MRLVILGKKIGFILTDVFSRFSWVYALAHKSEAFKTFKYWTKVQNQLSCELIAVQTDQRGEFLSNQFTKWLEVNGITHRLTNPYCHEEYGLVE